MEPILRGSVYHSTPQASATRLTHDLRRDLSKMTHSEIAGVGEVRKSQSRDVSCGYEATARFVFAATAVL